ncbi:MAG: S8 family serine peptidase, partial [Acidobacteriota bacterium]
MPAFLFLCVIPGSVSPVSPPGGGGRFPAGTPVHPPSSPPKARAGRSTPRPLLHRHLPPLFPAHRFVDPRDAARSGHLFRSLNGFIDLDAPDGGSAAPAGGIYLLTVKAGDSKGLRRLEAQGLNLLAPFGPEAYLVEGRDGTVLPGSIRLPRGSRLVPFSPEFIVDSSIGQPPVRSPQAARRPTLALQVGLIPGFDAAAVAQELQARGAVIRQVEQRPGSIAIIRFDLPYAGILPLVRAVPGLFRVEEDHLFQVAGEEVSSTMQAGEFFNGTAPFWDAGVDGGGGGLVPAQVIAVTDTGLSYDALHFSDTPTSAGTPGAAHSKLPAYVAVGGGDLMSCDAPASGGSTHGNVVAGVAAGNVSRFGIDLRSNQGWESAFTPFAADGVARGARVVFQDAQVQSFCAAAFDILSPGNLFDRMSEAKAMGAAVQNFSFSAQNTKAVYNLDSINVDSFLRQNRDYMTVIAVGNEGSDFDGDGNYEYGSITAPATAKNAIGVGASNSANEPINPFDPTQALSPGVPNDGVNLLAVFAEGTTGRGPAIFPSRVKPDLMAPGQDEFPNL